MPGLSLSQFVLHTSLGMMENCSINHRTRVAQIMLSSIERASIPRLTHSRVCEMNVYVPACRFLKRFDEQAESRLANEYRELLDPVRSKSRCHVEITRRKLLLIKQLFIPCMQDKPSQLYGFTLMHLNCSPRSLPDNISPCRLQRDTVVCAFLG